MATKPQIVMISPAVIAGVYGREVTFPVVAYAALDDGRLVGAGGLAFKHDEGEGRVLAWLWLDHVDMSATHPVLVVRWAKRMLRTAVQFGYVEVFSAREKSSPATPLSEKLIRMLGFDLYNDLGDVEIYRWQASPLLQPSPVSVPQS